MNYSELPADYSNASLELIYLNIQQKIGNLTLDDDDREDVMSAIFDVFIAEQDTCYGVVWTLKEIVELSKICSDRLTYHEAKEVLEELSRSSQDAGMTNKEYAIEAIEEVIENREYEVDIDYVFEQGHFGIAKVTGKNISFYIYESSTKEIDYTSFYKTLNLGKKQVAKLEAEYLEDFNAEKVGRF